MMNSFGDLARFVVPPSEPSVCYSLLEISKLLKPVFLHHATVFLVVVVVQGYRGQRGPLGDPGEPGRPVSG